MALPSLAGAEALLQRLVPLSVARKMASIGAGALLVCWPLSLVLLLLVQYQKGARAADQQTSNPCGDRVQYYTSYLNYTAYQYYTPCSFGNTYQKGQ